MERIPPGHVGNPEDAPARKLRRRWRQPSNRALAILMVGNLLGLAAVVSVLSPKADAQLINSARGAAAVCQILYDVGDDISQFDRCSDPAVAQYINTSHPPTVAGVTTTTR